MKNFKILIILITIFLNCLQAVQSDEGSIKASSSSIIFKHPYTQEFIMPVKYMEEHIKKGNEYNKKNIFYLHIELRLNNINPDPVYSLVTGENLNKSVSLSSVLAQDNNTIQYTNEKKHYFQIDSQEYSTKREKLILKLKIPLNERFIENETFSIGLKKLSGRTLNNICLDKKCEELNYSPVVIKLIKSQYEVNYEASTFSKDENNKMIIKILKNNTDVNVIRKTEYNTIIKNKNFTDLFSYSNKKSKEIKPIVHKEKTEYSFCTLPILKVSNDVNINNKIYDFVDYNNHMQDVKCYEYYWSQNTSSEQKHNLVEQVKEKIYKKLKKQFNNNISVTNDYIIVRTLDSEESLRQLYIRYSKITALFTKNNLITSSDIQTSVNLLKYQKKHNYEFYKTMVKSKGEKPSNRDYIKGSRVKSSFKGYYKTVGIAYKEIKFPSLDEYKIRDFIKE